nr:MAG TPA: hypothetical protein [Caudoviricetes sp.]
MKRDDTEVCRPLVIVFIMEVTNERVTEAYE